MKISEWKQQGNLTNAEIADRLSVAYGKPVTEEAVRKHIQGERMPNKRMALAYWQISNGLIDGNTHYDLPPPSNDQGMAVPS